MLTRILFGVAVPGVIYHATVHASIIDPVEACVVVLDKPINSMVRGKFAQCLGWQVDAATPICQGLYQPFIPIPLTDPNEINILADSVSFYPEARSQLVGHVQVRQMQRIVNAKTAYIYRDAKTKQVTHIQLLGGVRYSEPGKLMIAQKATINPHDKSGEVENALYRFDTQRAGAGLPAWGRASFIERFSNHDYLLRNVTYTTCPPQDKSWQIDASKITLDNAKETGVAKNALLRVSGLPVFYVPYISFPTSNARKSGFLMPLYGYSNVGGFDIALPYYWNIAPNYDATLIPHVYTLRGLMMGGDIRFLTGNTVGMVGGHFLPDDKAFSNFLKENKALYPQLRDVSSNRWSFLLRENTQFSRNLSMNINYQQVSDDYYLQDFSTNLAILTENQLLRQGDVTYTTDHWLFSGLVQSYQTLHPINQSAIADAYERMPQLLARGSYNQLPLNANFNVLGQFDYFHWPAEPVLWQPQGSRYHLNPVLSLPQVKPWGYVTPSMELVENHYDLHYSEFYNSQVFNRTIPRYGVDSGLFFERPVWMLHNAYTQTLEPRLYYLNVPYQNQSAIPAFESAYMIFSTNQLFRNNRFSGFDRIGDTNQLAYAITTRWLLEETGLEKASFTIGQIRYFADRRVNLCYNLEGDCIDNPLTLGYLSPVAKSSPIASQAMYRLNPAWLISAEYVWDVYAHSTNNGTLNLHYQPAENQIINFGYSYLASGNLMVLPKKVVQESALNQATFAYAWPLTDKWSSLGAYSYNISKGYSMMSFFGLQYEGCCWAVRLLGGRTFKSITPTSLTPQYNNNVYLQILLKGLGSVATSDPASVINSYLPGYPNIFRR